MTKPATDKEKNPESQPAESEKPNQLIIWDALQETDPNFTKNFNRGGYKGTSINPTYCYKKLTSVFGPCGIGWYVEVVKTETITSPSTKEVLLFKEINLFVKDHGEWSKPIIGHGGDFVVVCNKAGTPQEYFKADDEAHKKCFTDALTNAMKMLGMSADVHMGEYDDNKYINELKKKYAEQPPAGDAPEQPRAGQVKTVTESAEVNLNKFQFKDGEASKNWLAQAAKYIEGLKTELEISRWRYGNKGQYDALSDKQKAWLEAGIEAKKKSLGATLNDDLPF